MLTRLNDLRIRGAIAGGLGGLLSWFLIEPLVAPQLGRATSVSELLPIDALFGALAGLCIGAALGVAGGLIIRSSYRVLRGGLIGAGAGMIGGAIGLVIGELVYQPLQCLCFVGRSIGWAVFGAILGTAEGILRRSWRGLRSAALGGLIGGAIGGFAFDLVALFTVLLFRSDALSRGVALVIVGACIGLWIVIVERFLAPAVLMIISGQQEGQEFFLDKPRLTLGRDERGDIGIFGDRQVMPHHATLRQEDHGYVIAAVSGASLLVNDRQVSQHTLHHEDRITVGGTRLFYRFKGARKGAHEATDQSTPPVLPVQTPPARPPASSQPTFSPHAATGVLWLVDQRSGRRYALQPGVTTIGRSPNNDVVLDGVTISGHHAEVRYEGGRYILQDRNSRNGTFVNDRPIHAPNMIKAGWQVRLGDEVFTVES